MNRFVALLGALLLLGAGAFFGKQQLELQRHGLRAIGTVVDAKTVHEVRIGPDGVESHGSHSGVIEFVPDGAARVLRVSSDFWSRPAIGEPVAVLYLREDPEHAKRDTWRNWLWPALLGFFGAWCLLFALGLVGEGPAVTTDRSWISWRWSD